MFWFFFVLACVAGVANGFRIGVKHQGERAKFEDLHAKGVVSDNEFAVRKAKLAERWRWKLL